MPNFAAIIKEGAFDGDVRRAINAGFAALDNGVLGVGNGYKIARGQHTPTTAADTVVTGLATVVAAVAVAEGPPTLTHMFTSCDIGDQAGTPAAGSIIIRTQKPTGAADVTPIDATTPWQTVNWIAIGV